MSIKMSFIQFEAEMERFSNMPNVSKNHGITHKEMTMMEGDPTKYYRYAMYLLSREPYLNGGNNQYIFSNVDAALASEIAYRLDSLVDSTVDLFDSDDSSYSTSYSDNKAL